MSLKKNLVASYASQIYVTIIGIVLVPVFIYYMGAEAYGLVGFYAMLQVWFNLLDLGLTPTVARETARFRGGAIDAMCYRRLIRALELIFLLIGLVGGTALFAVAGYIAGNWLVSSQLAIAEMEAAIQMMAVIIAARWMGGLYRGAISGSERLVWLAGFNSAFATLRFVGVVPLLMFLEATPSVFFGFQVVVALFECGLLLFFAYRLLPNVPKGLRLSWNWTPIRPVLNFSLTIAFTSSVWVLVTQADKLVLSKILPLAEYGYFTVAVLVANSIFLISGPVSSAIMPRMSRLEAEHDHPGLLRVYRHATQLVAVLASATTITLVCWSESLLWAWTGDKVLALQAGPVLVLYALGNGIVAVAAFPYYLQYAKGNLRMHLIGNAVFVMLLLPAIVWAASQYGSVGAGYVWLGLNLISFVAWLPFVHHKFEPKLNLSWYGKDVLPIYVTASIVGYFFSALLPRSDNRFVLLGEIFIAGVAVMLAASLASSVFRARVGVHLNSLKHRR